VGEALAEIRRLRQAAELDPGFSGDWLDFFARPPADPLPREARSVLLLAVPRPAHRLVFAVEGVPVVAVVPPTYVAFGRLPGVVQAELAADGLEAELGLEPLVAPLKTIAARLGLVRYGRNNVTYAPGMGSYFQLVGFLTRVALEPSEEWRPRPARSLSACAGCDLCRGACPTGAIDEDRFLLRAERCRALHTETPGPWPERFPVESHDCLIGCLACQEVCPVNAGRLTWETLPVHFTEDETRTLLRETRDPERALPDGIRAKLDAIGMLGDAPVLGRNLGVLLRGPAARASHGVAS
jgi:epoxyqueuosine reductase